MDDYHAFARMMLNKGAFGQKRLVAVSSIEMMTANQLTPEQQQMGRMIFGENTGWGFGVSVLTNPMASQRVQAATDGTAGSAPRGGTILTRA